jgi:uncharacterized membrane protein YfcA
MKYIVGFMAGGLVGYLLGQVIPVEFFFITSIFLMFGAFLLFILFHIGLRDFQE